MKLIEQKTLPELSRTAPPNLENQPRLDRPVKSSSSEPLAIFAPGLPHFLQPGSLLFGEQSRDLLARVLSRLPKLLTKFTSPRLIGPGHSSLLSFFQQQP